MSYCGWYEIELHGQIYPSYTDIIKLFIVVFANGVIMVTLLSIFMTLNDDANFGNLSIDSTSIKEYPQSAGAKKAINSENNQFIAVSKCGKTTKIHSVVDRLGKSVHFIFTG